MNGAGKTSVITLLMAAQLSPITPSPTAAGTRRASRCPKGSVRISPDKNIQAVIDRKGRGRVSASRAERIVCSGRSDMTSPAS